MHTFPRYYFSISQAVVVPWLHTCFALSVGSMASSMAMQHSFHFVAKFSILFSKVPLGKDSNTSVFTKQVEKNLKKCFRKKVSKNWREKVDRGWGQTARNLIALWGSKYSDLLEKNKHDCSNVKEKGPYPGRSTPPCTPSRFIRSPQCPKHSFKLSQFHTSLDSQIQILPNDPCPLSAVQICNWHKQSNSREDRKSKLTANLRLFPV